MELKQLNSQEIQLGTFIFERDAYGLYKNYSTNIKLVEKSGELSRVLMAFKLGRRLKWSDDVYMLDSCYSNISMGNIGLRTREWDPDWKKKRD